ncbi:MAG: DUF4402 domain-containing protein [Bacteroidota bacterium]|nr:DUF4402 domain-containing protein [Bacteroidota bacterium]
MKIVLKIMAVLVLIACFTNALMAQTGSGISAPNTAGVKLIVPMSLSKTAALDFGTLILTNATGGTCTMASTGADRTVTGGVKTTTVAPIATNAAYNVTGTASSNYALTVPGTITVTNTVISGQTMDITAITARFANKSGADDTKSTLDLDGKDSFTLGGTLTIKANQAGGVYSAANFDVSIDYN